MVAQVENVDIRLIYEHVLSLQGEVKGVRDDCVGLGKQLNELSQFMVRTKTLEDDRNLPLKIEDQRKRIETLEHALTTAKAFSTFATILSTILALWLAFRTISGK